MHQEASILGWLINVVEPDPSSRFLNGIDEIVKPTGQIGDVFAIEWSDEGAVERFEDLVGNLVATTFKVPHSQSLAFDLTVMVEQVTQGLRHLLGVLNGLVEVVEKALIPGKEAC